MKRRELEIQLQALFDGVLEDDQFDALQRQLRVDPDARECYRDYLHLYHALSFRAMAADPLEAVRRSQPSLVHQKRFPKRSLLAIAASLVLAAIGSALAWNHAKRPSLQFITSPGTDITVTDEFTSTQQRVSGATLKPGSHLEIGKGTVELKFDSGVRGIVRGPASLTLFSADMLQLDLGTAWFKVPDKVSGFKVRTPDLVVNDAGAEFGITSDPSFLSEVHVFAGNLEATNRHGPRLVKWVAAGEARAAEISGEWQDVPMRRSLFLTTLSGPEPESNLIVDQQSSPIQGIYASEVSANDLLNGIIPITKGWRMENEASPLELTDGMHGVDFLTVPGDRVQGAWTTVGATAEYQLGKGPNGTGYDLTTIRSIADWANVGFGNQAWSMEVKPVGGDWMPLVSVAYEPLGASMTGGGTKVTVTGKDGHVGRGIEAIKVTAGRISESVYNSFVWRELDVFGSPEKAPVPDQIPTRPTNF